MAQSTYGTIDGQVSDAQGQALPDATVTVLNIHNGIRAAVRSNSVGQYVIPTLEPGVYDVSAEAVGFKSEQVNQTTVHVASSVTLNFSLSPGGVNQVVEVRADDAVVEKTTAELGTTVGENQLEDLPTNGRDYGRYSLQTPGALAQSRSIASLSFNGQQVIQNAFTIDGVDATRVDEPYMANGNERGARLLTGSLETLSEFKIQTSGAEAEYGRAAAASMNIVTRSGGNNLHGTVYDYLRNDALDARNYFAKAEGTAAVQKPEFRFNDFGAALSGPIRRDNTFYFLNYEGDRQVLGTTSTGTIPSDALRAKVLQTSPALAPILNLMPVGGTPTTDPNINNYTVVGNSTIQEDTGSARIDHQFSDHDSLFGRVNINNSVSGGARNSVSANAFGPLDFQYVPIRITNIAIHEQHAVGAFYNDALFGVQRVATTLDSNNGFPSTSISGLTISVGNSVTSINGSSLFQGGDNMTLVHERHTFMWGGAYYHIWVNYYSTAVDSMSFASINAFINNQLNTISVAAPDPGHTTVGNQFGAFAQDSWKLTRNLTVNYGLRWDFEPPIHDANNVTEPFDPRINGLAPPGTSYYDTNWKSFAPRLGMAYGLADHTVIHAAFGLFFLMQPVGNGTYSLPLNNIKGNISLSSATTAGLNYPIEPWIAAATGTQNTAYGFPRNLPDQYAEQYNLSLQQQLTPATTMTAAYVGVHGVHLERFYNINLKNVSLGARPLTGFGDVWLQGQSGMNLYNALQLTFLHRSGKGFTTQANYAWAHTIDDVADGSNSTGTAPQNLADLAAERGTGGDDIRHNFSGNLLYEIPMGKGHLFLGREGTGRLMASGWQIDGSSIIRTGSAVNVTMSTNTSGDGNTVNQRPNINYSVDPYLHQGIAGYLNPAAFTTPAAGTFGNSPRDPVHAPGFTQLDLSLMKNTAIGESRNVQFRAEFFNIFNHPIFGGPSSNISNATTFGTITSIYGGTVGLGTPRQIEFALKYQF